MWFQKNKWKIIIPLLIIGILALAFFKGGPAQKDPSPALSASGTAEPIPSPVSETDRPSGEPARDTGDTVTDPEYGENTAEAGKTSETADPNLSEGPEPSPMPDTTPIPETTPMPDTTPMPEKVPEAQPEQTPEPQPEQTAEPDTETTMEIDPETGKDRYQTDPVPEGMPEPVEPQDAEVTDQAYSCTISISCATILNNMDLCDPDKRELVPEDGWILLPTVVTFYDGESVFNVLQRTCKQNRIHMEFENTPIYNSAYIEGIHNLYEFDVGDLSGWMYKVNDWFPNYGCSRYQLKDGDVICWVYTCDLGYDVGGGYALG